MSVTNDLFGHPPPAVVKAAPPKKKKRPEITPEIIAAFEAWWEHYPVHNGKKDALRAFADVYPEIVDLQTLIDGADRYAAFLRAHPDRQPKWPQGWLHGERWTDRLDGTPRSASASRGASFARAGAFFRDRR